MTSSGAGRRFLLVPELAHEVITVSANHAASHPLTGVGGKISDAVRLPDGEIIVLLRDYGLAGLRTAFGVLVDTPEVWWVERCVPLGLGLFRNFEEMTAQPLSSGGGTRLWFVTDDNFQLPMATDLFALGVPPGRWRGAD